MRISRVMVISLMIVSLTWGAAYAQNKATISLPTLDVDPGTRINVPITVTTDSSIGIAQFVVEYNSSVLSFVDAYIGSDMPGGFSLSNVNPNLPFPPGTPGADDNVLVQISGGGSRSFSGANQETAVLEFDVVGAGGASSPLAFDEGAIKTYLSTLKLYDIAGGDINFGTGSVSIIAPNSPPTATNLTISPASPGTGDNLVASYDYNDVDGDPEGASEIRWYKNSTLQAAYNDVKTVPAAATTKGDDWYFTVRPTDGEDFGDLATSGTTTIANTAPVAANVIITPASPFHTDDLTGSYDYSDADGDARAGSEIRWYKNGVLQPAYNDILAVPSSATIVGEKWYFTVKPKDGTDFGDLQTSATVTITGPNTPPTATNLSLAPAVPITGDDLNGSYDYNDINGDPEGATEIRWYKNSVVQPAYNDVLTVPASATNKGEAWYFTVRPNDGKDLGDLATSGTVTVGNTAPQANNVILSPSNPLTSDDLTANYDFIDADSDPEGSTQIRWYQDGVHQAAFDDQATVPNNQVSSGEEWYFTVKPHDGEAFGNLVESNHVTVNNIPEARNATLSPASPLTSDDLVGSYDYFDGDGDPEGSTRLRWYKNGAPQTGYNDQLTVPASATAKGEEWYFTVQANDGKEYGAISESNHVTILNTAPVASNLSISPASPLDSEDLVGSYDYSDADGDAETGTEIRWYKDGAVQPAYNDVLTVPASATVAGEQWYFTVKPNDGTDFGDLQTSATVTVRTPNSPPTASSLSIIPFDPNTLDELVGDYNYDDVDGDPEGATEIRWYQDDVLQSGYNDVQTIPPTATRKGEEWYFTVRPHDGKVYGDLQKSGAVTIRNAPPEASNLSLSPASPADNDDLVLDYQYNDVDGDAEQGTEIRWYKDGVVQSSYDDLLTVPASATAAGEEWYFTVSPADGENYGQLQSSSKVTIGVSNTPPTATNLTLVPADPVTGDDLIGNYDYNDADGDPQGSSEIRWYKDGAVQSAYDDVLIVPASATKKGEAWNFTVSPHDGKEFGGLATSATVTIGNTAPIASNLSLSPASPLDSDDLVGSYDFSDADGDAPVNSEIRWYKNSVVQPAYNDLLTVPGSATTAGEKWYFTVKPNDGTDFGELQTSPTVTIGVTNTPPTATNLAITPADPKTGDNLTASYNYNDVDGDAEGASEIRWYKNGLLQSAYNEVKTIPATATKKGEQWYFTVRPNDGKAFGDLVTSDTVTIGNTLPVASNLTITPINPLTGDDLVASYDYADADGDGETGTEIRWYKNGAAQAAYDDVLTVPSSATAAGEEWYFTVKPNDGSEFGVLQTSVTVTIGESQTYTLAVTIDPQGGGTVSRSLDKATYDPVDQVTLTAVANQGYEFDHWSGDAAGTDPVVTITMDSNKNVTAHFKLITAIQQVQIKSIVVTKQRYLKFVRGKAEVQIVDAYDNRIGGARVIGRWSRGASDEDRFVVGADGRGTAYSKWTIVDSHGVSPEFTFTVIRIEKEGWEYDAGLCGIVSGSSEGKEETLTAEDVNLNELDLQATSQIAWNNPNPFNPSTTINFVVPQASHVRVEIYNVLGKRIVTLLDRDLTEGFSSVVWNAKDENGVDVTSGTYLYKISFDDGQSIMNKILFMK